MIQDTVHHEQFGITDEIDVTTMKDYMQVRRTINPQSCYTPAGYDLSNL